MQIPQHERIHLRELARKQAEYAALPIMGERRKGWYDHNDGRPGARPPVVIETWTFNRDFMPAGICRCESEAAKGIEWRLLENIRNHELINDDKVIPDRFEIGWHTQIDHCGVKVPRHAVEDSQGQMVGFEFEHPIKDLKQDLHLIKPPTCSVDRVATYERKAQLEDLFGDILPVEIRTSTFGNAQLTQRVVELMGMEAFFTAMYDTPDEVHQLMRLLTDSALYVMRWAESEGLLRLNNANQVSFGSSYNFTRKLPGAEFAGAPAKLSDMWGFTNSQETVGISTEMFHEFCAPYYREVVEPYGLLYYGCCEPADPFWDDISSYPHLKKVSISRWANEAIMGEALRGRGGGRGGAGGIVYSRKPDPNFLGVAETLDEEAYAAHIRKTLEHTRDVPVEFIVRDVYTVHGNLDKPRRAVEIARREIARHRG